MRNGNQKANQMGLQMTKRFLFAISDMDDDMPRGEANEMIYASNDAAFESLSKRDKVQIRQAAEGLKVNIKSLGDIGALELLSVLSEYLETAR